MKLNKKSVAVIFVLLIVSIAGWFLVSQNSKNEQSKQSEKQNVKIFDKVNKQNEQNNQNEIVEDKNEELVWYEIPELNIKFKIPKEMADLIGYRDFYVQDVKADGKELYIKDKNNKIVFAKLILDRAVKNKTPNNYQFLSQYCLGNKDIKTLIVEQEDFRVCYLNAGNSKEYSSITKDEYNDKFVRKLLQGYLENVPVSFIK